MKKAPRKSAGKNDVVAKWDTMTPFDRLELIRANPDIFWNLRLVSRGEIEAIVGMSESSRKYVVEREINPLLESIHLKKELAAQTRREKLEAALNAVFLK